MTTDSTTPTGRPQRSLPFMVLAGAVVFGLVLPQVDYQMARLFGERPPAPSMAVWIELGAVLAVIGACVGAAVHLTQKPGREGLHALATGIGFALAMGAEVEDFTSATSGAWIARYLIVSVVVGLVLSVIVYAARHYNDPVPPAEPPR
jgi:hypothetical protein